MADQLELMGIESIFIFPKGAKNKNWEVDLSRYKIYYTDWDIKNIQNILSKELTAQSIVHGNFISDKGIISIYKACEQKHAKLVIQDHMLMENSGNLLKRSLRPIYKKREHHKISKATKDEVNFIGISEAVYQKLKSEYPKNKNIYCIDNAIALDRLTKYGDQKKDGILIFGTHFHRKGVDLAIKAIMASSLREKVSLNVVTHDEKGCLAEIENLFGSKPDFVKIIPPTTNISEYYKKNFLFLSPSRAEAFGYSVVEAAYSGLSVICSNVPGQNTLKGIPGIIWIENENVGQLRDAIESAYENFPNKQLEDTRKYVEGKYSIQNWAKQVINVYEK